MVCLKAADSGSGNFITSETRALPSLSIFASAAASPPDLASGSLPMSAQYFSASTSTLLYAIYLGRPFGIFANHKASKANILPSSPESTRFLKRPFAQSRFLDSFESMSAKRDTALSFNPKITRSAGINLFKSNISAEISFSSFSDNSAYRFSKLQFSSLPILS